MSGQIVAYGIFQMASGLFSLYVGIQNKKDYRLISLGTLCLMLGLASIVYKQHNKIILVLSGLTAIALIIVTALLDRAIRKDGKTTRETGKLLVLNYIVMGVAVLNTMISILFLRFVTLSTSSNEEHVIFEYKPGDIIIRDRKFYEANHMMVVLDVRPNELVVSHLTFGGLQLYTFHRETSVMYPTKENANQKVLRWTGDPRATKEVVDLLERLHNENVQIEYSGWEAVKNLWTPCYSEHPTPIFQDDMHKVFENGQMYCSSYVTMVWKYVLEKLGVPNEVFPLNPSECFPEQVYDILSHIPEYWEVFFVQTRKQGHMV